MGVGKRIALPVRTAGLAALAVTATLAAAQDQEQADADPATSTALAASAPALPPPFIDEFAPFSGARPDLNIPSSAVDLSEFDPPVEEEQTLRTLGAGVASFYGRRFHGRLTANGERFNMNAMTAAHKTLPFGTKVRVTNPRNGKSVVVRINDRGPFIRGRTIDLSRAAAREIGMIARGHARVELDIVK